jgi:hypothetical protein
MVIIFIVLLGADDHIVIAIMIMKIKPTPMMIVTMTNLIPCFPRHGNHKHSNNILDMIVTAAVQVTVPVCHHHRPCPYQEQAAPPPNLPFLVLGEGRPNRLMYSSCCFVNAPGSVDCSDCHVFRLNLNCLMMLACCKAMLCSLLHLCTPTGGLPFRNSFDFILTPTPQMLSMGRKLLISRVYKTQHA